MSPRERRGEKRREKEGDKHGLGQRVRVQPDTHTEVEVAAKKSKGKTKEEEEGACFSKGSDDLHYLAARLTGVCFDRGGFEQARAGGYLLDTKRRQCYVVALSYVIGREVYGVRNMAVPYAITHSQ